MSGRLSVITPRPVRERLVAILLTVAVGAGAAAGLVIAGGASAALPAPPAIVAGPEGISYSPSAFFTFSAPARVSFTCRLDTRPWTPCGAATRVGRASYGKLAAGPHVLSVFSTSETVRSAVTSFRWRYAGSTPAAAELSHQNGRPTGRRELGRPNRTRARELASHLASPTAAIVFPAHFGRYTGSSSASWQSWAQGCPVTGFCGFASRGSSPIAAVSISVRHSADGRCWDGASSFDQSCPHWLHAAGAGTWRRAFAIRDFPSDGVYVLSVLVVDRAGRSSGAHAQFTIDRTAPPVPVIAEADASGSSWTFNFAYQPGVSLSCSLDGAPYVPCGGTVVYGGLSAGPHRVCVTARDAAGNGSAPACYEWTALPNDEGGGDGGSTGGGVVTAGGGFGISGTPLAGTHLYPGGPDVAVNLVFTNNGDAPITITSAGVSVTSTSGPTCSLADFAIPQALQVAPVAVVVPPRSTRSLLDLGVPQGQWPTIRMRESGTSQDGCRGASVNLSFAGTGSGG